MISIHIPLHLPHTHDTMRRGHIPQSFLFDYHSDTHAITRLWGSCRSGSGFRVSSNNHDYITTPNLNLFNHTSCMTCFIRVTPSQKQGDPSFRLSAPWTTELRPHAMCCSCSQVYRLDTKSVGLRLLKS